MRTPTEETGSHVLSRLDDALATGEIASIYHEWAIKLRDRLREPIQVIVLGAAGVGKSTLLDTLVGRTTIGGMKGTPEIHIVHGTHPRCYVEYYDNRSEWRAGLLSEQEFEQPVARACQELPDAMLAERNLIEIGLPDKPEEAGHVAAQAMASADILVWCLSDFTPLDRQLLSRVPDRLRDHAMLVLTKSDKLRINGKLNSLMAAIEPVSNDGFLGLFPLSLVENDPAGEQGRRLKNTLNQQIEMGRAADLDQVRMILRQSGASAQPVPNTAKPTSAPQPSPPTPSRKSLRSEQELANEAALILRKAGQDLLSRMDQVNGAIKGVDVLDHCRQTLDALSAFLGDKQSARRARGLIEEGREMLLLIQLEKGASASLDAVTLLLQLRREVAAMEGA